MSRLYISGNAVDQNQIPVVGARVFVRANGELAALQDAAGAVTPNPIVTIANGFFEAYSTTPGTHTLEYYWGGRLRRVDTVSDAEAVQAAAQAALAAAGAPSFPNTAAGLAGVAFGETFYVVTAGVGVIYRKDAGPVATEISRFIVDPSAAGAAALIGKAGGGTVQDVANATGAANRAAVTALDPANSKTALLTAQGDRSLFKLDTRVPAGETGATNERTQGYNNPGRTKRFIAPGTGTGRFVSEDGVTHVSHYGISPWNTAGQNDAAWNALRDEITDLQTRQENRPLVLQFDNYRYDMSDQWQVRNNHLTFEGRGAELVGGGIFFTNNGSVNQQLYCAIKDMVIRGAAGQSIPVLRSRVSSYLTVDNVTLYGTAGQHGAYLGGGNTSTFKQLRVYGAGLYGIFMTAENAPHPSGGVAGRGQPIDLTFIDMDVQGCGGGVGIYEAQSIRFIGGAIQDTVAGVYGRGLSIETGYDISVFATHFERNGADVVIEPVDRLGTPVWGAPLPHGSITLAGLGIGGEGIGGAPGPTSLLVAGDTPDLMVTGGYYAGSVNINTTGTTGAIIGAKMPIYSAVAGSPLVKMGARGAAVADAAAATYVAPSGGATVDTEARAALAQLAADVASLRTSNNTHLARQRAFGAIAS